MENLFLGLDCSTQSLSGIIIDFNRKRIVCREDVIYGADLTEYRTKQGILLFKNKNKIHSNPLMWLEALEVLFKKFKDRKIDLRKIITIAGSGQQHGTVYLKSNFEDILVSLDPRKPSYIQLKDCFSRETSPIWMDSSTSKECSEIREALGGKRNTIKITGSDIFERFSGPQIRKFYKENPERYSGTDKIHLVSSFMASILAGSSGPIDYADGSGMNLMNIKSKEWDPKALSATAPELEEKLPPLARSDLIVGDINSFFVRRFGFSPKCKIAIWSGDNPNSLIGLGIIEEKNASLSLGTSDTYFAYLKRLQLDYKGESHLFGAPTGDYMGLICFKNGSLARERIKDKFNLDWKRFSKILSKSPPGNFGKIVLPYFYAEIVPPVLKPQVFRFWLDDSDLVGNVRAIIESQFLSMRLHSTWINEKPEVIMATGGASANKEILQTASNIFQAKILKFDITNSAALGATFRAIHASNKKINKNLSWNAIIENFLLKRPYKAITPQKEYANIYDKMLKLYEACEDYVLKGGEKPTKLREEFLQTYSFNKNV